MTVKYIHYRCRERKSGTTLTINEAISLVALPLVLEWEMPMFLITHSLRFIVKKLLV